MPENISDQFASELMSHAIDLARFESHEREVLLKLFRDLEAELLDRLRRNAPDEPSLSVHQRARAERLLTDVRSVIGTAYRTMAVQARRDFKELAIVEAEATQQMAADLVLDSIFSSLPSESTLRTLVDDLTLQGVPLKSWWQRQAGTTFERYGGVVRQGIIAGDSTSGMVKKLRGTQAAHYQDGVFESSRRGVTTLVRTSVNSVANEARLETFRQNSDVLRGIEWLTGADSAVCPICRPISGQTWNLDGRKLPGTRLDFPGPPPRH